MNGLRPSRLLTLVLLAGLLAAPALLAQAPAIESTGFHVFGPNGVGGPFGVVNLCPNQNAPFTHWDLRQFPGCSVPYEVNGIIGVAGNPTPAQAAAAVDLAAASWSAVTPAHITLFNNTAASSVACPRAPTFDARNCVAWDPAFPFGGNVLGVTFLWRNAPTGIMIESDITLNPVPAGFTWQASPPVCGPTPIGIEAVMLHEFGHTLGLAHPNQLGCANDDPLDTTVMFASYTNACETALSQPDKDGANYLYTADLGDHPDPPYATKVHSGVPMGPILSNVILESPARGPSHLYGLYRDSNVANAPRYQYEWLAFKRGAIDDHPLECEARPADFFDDGVSIKARCVNGIIVGNVSVTLSARTATDVRGRTHAYGANNAMYLNGWFDWNGDGDFQDPGEHAIGPGAGVAVFAAGSFNFVVPPPAGTKCDVRSRFRLDWREDVGQVLLIDGTLNREFGAAQHGEVEDYRGITQLHHHNDYLHPYRVPVLFPAAGLRLHLFDIVHAVRPYPIDSVRPIFFPAAGRDCMESTLCLKIDGDADEIADEDLCLTGPVCVDRRDVSKDPVDGRNIVETQMVSLDMAGYSHFAGQIQISLAKDQPSLGLIKQSEKAAEEGIDVSPDSPASSYFDVNFVVQSELLGASDPVSARVEAEITSVPPGELIGEEEEEPSSAAGSGN